MADRTAPPFSALRAVEAASRHRSFTWAARELKITHSAVSQSIRRLEAELGATLFERRGGAMEPSEAALRLAQCYSSAAETLSEALRDISGQGAGQAVTLGMPVDFGRQWFAGRLGRLADAVPDIRYEIRTQESPDEPDAEILFEEKPRGSDQVLTEIDLFPIGGQDFIAAHGIRRPADVLAAPLYSDSRFGWDLWIRRHAPGAAPRAVQSLDDPGMAMEAALGGGGLFLAHVFTAEAAIDSGRAVPVPLSAPAPSRLILRSRGGAAKADAIGRLFMWLKLEIARTVARQKGRGD
jgi:DNA-binding transcriptional LysR family regulator